MVPVRERVGAGFSNTGQKTLLPPASGSSKRCKLPVCLSVTPKGVWPGSHDTLKI